MRSSLFWARRRAPGAIPWHTRRHYTAGRVWSDDQLATTEKYPLSEKLLAEFDPRPRHKLKGRGGVDIVHLRPQIVSPDLCDDLLAYHGHTLEKHRGCDILDINPGVGLWSSKLHEFLKPRSHILLESEPKRFAQFLQPLVDQDGSKYKLVEGNPTEFPTFDKLIREGMFPHQKTLKPGDAQANEPNDSLLVTGTLAWDPPIPGMAFDSMAKQMFIKLITLSGNNEVFHAFGRARMLFWFLKDELTAMQPRGILHAGKTNVTARKFAKVTEVVGADSAMRRAGGSIGREARYDLESMTRLLKIMQATGVTLPEHRRAPIHGYAEEVLEMTNGTGSLSSSDCTEYLREKVQGGHSITGLATEKAIESFKVRPRQMGKLGRPGVPESAADKEHRKLQYSMKRLEKLRVAKDAAADLGYNVYELECKILGMEEGTERSAELQRLEKLQSEFEVVVGKVDQNYRNGVRTDIDDRISIRSSTARIAVDERTIESLTMKADEVWPPNRMSLADIQPHSVSEPQSAEALDFFIDFLYGLHAAHGSNVIEALEKLQPGASELVEQLPVFRDPARGGRLNLNELRVRMLTPDMIQALSEAYRSWPFRHPEANHPGYFRARTARKSEYLLD